MSTVAAIFVTSEPGAAMRSVEAVEARAGLGLMGDRYFSQAGTLSRGVGSRQTATPRDVTLIEEEAVEAVRRDHDIVLEARETRRNILTRGVALNHLVGREFLVGGARLRGIELCEPCGHLERLTRTGVRKALVHRGGLRCAIVGDGTIAVGDPVRLAEDGR